MLKYHHARLCFKALLIEQLEMDELFQIDTSEGVFRMTKGEFYRDFPNVITSKSYKEDGIYHYRKIPAKARPYLVSV